MSREEGRRPVLETTVRFLNSEDLKGGWESMDTWVELSQLLSGRLNLLFKGYMSGQGRDRVQLVNVSVQAELRGGGR